MAAPQEVTYRLTFACDEDGNIAVWIEDDEVVNDLEHPNRIATAKAEFTFRFPRAPEVTSIEATAQTGEIKTS
jgi:hypothetical protein